MPDKKKSPFVGLALILLGIGIAAIVYLVRTGTIHDYILGKIIQKTQEATGGQVEIGDYDFHWFGPRADVHRLVIRGTERDPTRPLVVVDRLSVSFRIISILRGKVDLSDVSLHHPVVHLQVREDGTTNVPLPAVPEKDQRPVNIFDLALRQFQIEQGELYYNNSRVPLSAVLHGLQTQVRFDFLQGSYEGSLRYQQGRVQFSDFNPLEHDLEAEFTVAASGLQLEQFLLTTAQSRISLRGNLNDYGKPTVEGLFDALISTEDVRAVLKVPSLPIGQVTTAGSLQYRNDGGASFLDSLLVDGQLHSPLLAIRLPQARGDLREVRSHYRLEEGNLVADGLRANLLGGDLTGDFTIRHLSENPVSRFRASIRSIALNAVSRALPKRSLEGMSINGDVNGTLEATWHGDMQNIQIQSDIFLHASTPLYSSGVGSETAPIPVQGVAHIAYDSVHDTLSVNQSYLRTPHTQIRIDGTASARSSIRVEAITNDLREVDRIAQSFRAASSKASQSEPLELQGSATISGKIEGPTETLRFAGQLMVSDLQLRRERVRLLHAQFEMGSSGIALNNSYLETVANARIEFDFSTGLQDWAYNPSQPITIRASTKEFPASELQHLLGFQYPITGTLTADVSLGGSQLRPEGQGSIQLTEGTLWEQPVQNLTVEIRGNSDSLSSTIAIQTPAGNASGNWVYFPENDGYELQLEAEKIQIGELEAVRGRNLGVAGELALSGQGRGTLPFPQLDVTVQIPQLQVREHRMDDVNSRVSLAGKQVNISVDSKMEGGGLQATASVNLTQEYDVKAKLNARNMPLGLVLASYMPRMSSLLGQTEIHASLQGPLKNPARLEAHVEIPTFGMGYRSIQIANVRPIHMDYKNEVLTLQRVQMKGTGTDLQLEGTANLRGGGNLNGSVTGTLDLQIMQILRPELESSGQVRLNIRARGGKDHPDIEGDVRINEATFRSPNAPLGAERVSGDLVIRNNRILINQLRGRSGGGTLSASGSVILGSRTQFNLGISASGVRLRYPHGVRTAMDGHLALTGGTESAVLSGRVLVDRLSFTNDFDLATFLDEFRGASPPPPSEGFTQSLRLNVAIMATEALGLESAKLSLQGSGNLSLRGTLAQPVILGRANLTGGEVFFLGHRYEVQNGVITFTNPFRTEPVVNLAVRTTVSQYDLNLNFIGPMENLRTTYTSDPPLPPVDIVNLLAFGRIATAGDSNGNTPPSLGAQSVLARGLSSQVSGQVERLAGLSHLSIDPTIGGSQQNPGARLAIQQRVTSNLLFTFSMDVASTQSEFIQLEYQVNRGWSVRGIREENGGYAIDVKRRKTF